jgi:LacI family transcriptional regulator
LRQEGRRKHAPETGKTNVGKAVKVTIRTVAKDAGVSVTAVSNVLRNAYGVSDAMREKVLISIAKLGYRPSTAARAMRGRTYTVGVLALDLANPFLSELVGGIQEAVEAAGFKLMISVGRGQSRLESDLIETMIDTRMDGLILVAPHLEPQILDRFSRQIPMVLIGHHEPEAASFDTANCDDEHGARMAVRALYTAGHRNIRMISLPHHELSEADVSIRREAGYKMEMRDLGLADKVAIAFDDSGEAVSQTTGESLAERMQALLVSAAKPVAFFCWSDLHAITLIDQARAMGLQVPGQVAVIGFDNAPSSGLRSLGLSSIDQNGRALGAKAWQLLLQRINGRTAARHELAPPNLVTRQSI